MFHLNINLLLYIVLQNQDFFFTSKLKQEKNQIYWGEFPNGCILVLLSSQGRGTAKIKKKDETAQALKTTAWQSHLVFPLREKTMYMLPHYDFQLQNHFMGIQSENVVWSSPWFSPSTYFLRNSGAYIRFVTRGNRYGNIRRPMHLLPYQFGY